MKLHYSKTFFKFLLVLSLFISEFVTGQVVIAKQDFETIPSTPIMTFTTSDIGTPGSSTNFSTGNSGSNSSPQNANLFSEGARGYRIQGPNSGSSTAGRIFTFSNVNTTNYTNISASFRVAGMSIGSTGNGIDTTVDQVLIEISPDGGTNWYQQAVVVSTATNLSWYFGATGSGSRNYLANNTFSTFNTTSSVVSGSSNSAITTVTINNLPSVSNLRIRVSAQVNSANESWIIDDVRLFGTSMPSVPTVVTTVSSLIGTDSATLNGSINANTLSTDATFQYGTSTSYGSSVSATPSTVTGSTATSISASINSLSLNTQYHYRAVGTVSGTPTNGSDMTFYTLAATPGVLTINNPLQTTIDVTVDATTQNGNPASTQYAIQEIGGQYVQANGTLGASEVWQTAATWTTTTVTGLSTSTTYTFQAKARNGANVETGFGTSANGTTLAAQLVDYAVVQFPNTTQSILEGTNLTVYARAYEPGLTTLNGAQSNLFAWIGYSSTNVDPANTVFTWVPATFNTEFGNDDEYQATLTGLPIGTYYYAARFQIGTGPYVYAGSNGIWNNDNVTLNINADVVDFANVQFPTTATITEGNTVTVYAQVYEPGVTEAAGQGPGITAEIGYSTTDSTPDATWTWTTTTFNVQVGNNDEYQATIGSNLAPGTYYYASRFQKTGSSTYVYGGTTGIWSTGNSGVLTVNALGNPNATAATNITPNSFTANWDAVTDATSYRLDVSTSPTFTGTPNTGDLPWINEFHYDNASTDTGEFVEIVVPNSYSGTNLTISLYNGNGGVVYDTKLLSSLTVGNLTTNQTIYYYNYSSIQNGPDGISLSDDNGLIEFISYGGGTFSATEGPANGTLSTDIGQSEGTSTPVGYSLQLSGTGNSITNFSWQPEGIATKGSLNTGQTLTAPSSGTLAFVPGYENLDVGNVTSYNVTGLTQGTTYYYRVRAVGQTTSSNSNVINVTTGYSSVTWNGTSWTNTVGPDSTIDAIIEGVYSTSANGAFNAKKVTVNSGSLTVNSDTTIEIQDELVNNLTSAAVIVENNAVLRQFNNVANTGQITVRRNSADALRLDYTAWSSPVSDQNALAFSPATLPNRFYDYDAASNAYVSIVPSTTDFTAGKGILIRTPNNWSSTTPAAYPGEFKGVLNNGDVTTAVVDGFNLLGNPYTSPISATSFLLNTNNSSTLGMNTIHFWTHTIASNPVTGTYATSNYATHNGAGGVAAAAGGEEPDGIIQVGQGFVVEVDVNGTAVFNNSMRLSASNGQFFKSANQTTTLERHRMWLDLTSPQYSHNQILVGYIEGATNALDPSLDAKLFAQSNSVIYSTINNSKYVIQSRALPFSASDVVPLGLIAQTAGQYTISMNHVDGLFGTQDIYLKDNLLNITHDIKGSPYTFVSDAGQFDARFEIVYAAPLSNELPVFTENSVIVYTNEAGITINAGQTIIDNVKVYDVRGRLLFSQQSVNANSLVLDKINTANQVLILQIGSVDNKVISKKIVN